MSRKISVSSQTWYYGNFWLTIILTRMPENLITVIIKGNDKCKEREFNKSSAPLPAVIYNVDGPKISPSEIVNIAPGEG